EDGIRDDLVTGVQTCALPILYFLEDDPGRIQELVSLKRDEGGGAIKLTNSDPWIAEIRRKRPGIFASENGEYFLFPLIPLDSSRSEERRVVQNGILASLW